MKTRNLLSMVLAGLLLVSIAGCQNDPIKTTRNGVNAPGKASNYFFPTGSKHLLERLIDCHWSPTAPGQSCATQGMALDQSDGGVYASIQVDDVFTGCEPVVKLTARSKVNGQPGTEADSYYTLVQVERVSYITGRQSASQHWGQYPSNSAAKVSDESSHLGDLKRANNLTRDDFVATLRLIIKTWPKSPVARICHAK